MMARKYPLVHLEEICDEFDYIVWDTCALMSPLEIQNKSSNKSKQRIKLRESKEDSYTLINKYFKSKGNCFVPELVVQEVEDITISPIRETLVKYDNLKLSKNDYRYYKKICATRKARKALLTTLKKRIIVFNKDEKREYCSLYENNKDLLEKRYILNGQEKKLGPKDYEIVISAFIFGRERGKTALLSNDHPLLYAAGALRNKERIPGEDFSCFRRDKAEYFSRVA